MSSFDITVLSAQDFHLEVYTAVTSQLKNITDEKIKRIVDEVLEKHIARALKTVGKNEDHLDQQIKVIKASQKCQELSKAILDMVLSMRLVKMNIGHQTFPERHVGEGDILIMSTKVAKEIKASMIADLEQYQRCGTPELEDSANVLLEQPQRPNTPVLGQSTNRPDTPVI